MLEKVKKALRISHQKLDDDILANIETAKKEMIRAGVDAAKVARGGELIESAIKTYCLMVYAPDEKRADQYFFSFQYQLDNIRKSSDV